LTDRFEDQLHLLRKLGEEAHARHAEAVIILGDIFDKKLLDPVTATHSARAFSECFNDVALWFLGGNHDANNLRGDRFLVEKFESLKKGGPPALFLDVDIRPRPWLRFWPAHYATVEATRETLQRIRSEIKDEGELDEWIDVLLFHNSILGCSHMAWKCDEGFDPDEVCKGFNAVLSGHFHTAQEFGACGQYLGAPMQHHFGDVGEDRGFWEFTISEDGDIEQEFVPTTLPRFHKFKTYQTKLKGVDAGDYVWFEIEATHADWQALRAEGAALKAKLEGEELRVRISHKPIYHHEARLGNSTFGDGQLKLPELSGKYVDSVQVVTGNLDPERLKRIGLDAFKAVGS
jgi:DNA repair exonuclease SbcCD nuclease subunit